MAVEQEVGAVEQRLAETLERIRGRVSGWQAEEAEKRAALSWCRANGNPHKLPAPSFTDKPLMRDAAVGGYQP